ncbi:hypothetical protein [Vitiosangium sp. GDMCC 1.1324]|uniref:hypothetical protein n=1 Tax=Vitiosangium sp. (strain GDMCC 1.1324) TaxID=2138576 RepID=UPI0011B36898|nr:hypothetical protein [Vitiosangium sp. GDMCC 1.1324]
MTSFSVMNAPRFIAHLASDASVFAYLEEEQGHARQHVYAVAAGMELGLKISEASEPLRNLLEWLGKKNDLLSQRKQSLFQDTKSNWVWRYIPGTRSLLPPVLIESFRPLRQLERVATLFLALQRRIGPLLEEARQKPALRVLLEGAGAERKMMAAFADFTAEMLGIELAHREIAALAILIGYEEPTSDQDETTRRVWKWTNARQNSKDLLTALRQLTGRMATSPTEATTDTVDAMKISGPSPEPPPPPPSGSTFGDLQK